MNSIGSSRAPGSDALSGLLALLDVQSFLSRRMETTGSWALRFSAYRHMKFGGVIEGHRWIWTDDMADPVALEAGDFYLLSSGAPYCIASNIDASPVDGHAFRDRYLDPDGVIRFDRGGHRTIGVGGRFEFADEDASTFLRSMLPPLIHIPGNLPQARALRAALDLLTFETEERRSGSGAIGASLCAIVLVNMLRVFVADEGAPGWLGALRDRQIGTAIQAMHGDIARRWRVADLATQVGMSRAAFAERFKLLVGIAPLEYLSNWRMLIARNALKRERSSLAVVARSIGYESETAFSLAFKQKFGISPGRYRSGVRAAAAGTATAVD